MPLRAPPIRAGDRHGGAEWNAGAAADRAYFLEMAALRGGRGRGRRGRDYSRGNGQGRIGEGAVRNMMPAPADAGMSPKQTVKRGTGQSGHISARIPVDLLCDLNMFYLHGIGVQVILKIHKLFFIS